MRRPTDKDSCGSFAPYNGFLVESLVEGLAGQSLAERYTLYLCLGFKASAKSGSRANRELMETDLPWRGGIWQVVNVLTPDRCLGRSKINRVYGLTAGFFGHPAGGTEDARNQQLRP